MRFDDYLIDEVDYSPMKLDVAEIYTTLTKDCGLFLKELEKTGSPIPKNAKSIPTSLRWLLRGTMKSVDKIKKFTPRTDRRPKDTPDKLHNLFDKEFRKRFGWAARSEGVFVTSNYKEAKSYGTPYIFFPIGRYDYIWSPKIADLYDKYESAGYTYYFEGENPQDWNDWSWDWHKKYGEEKEGHWMFSTFELDSKRLEKAVEEVNKLVDAGGITSKEVRDNDFKWVPDVEEVDYIDQKIEEFEKEIEEQTDKWLSTYRGKGNLKGAINSGHEVMVKCNSYYLVNTFYQLELAKMIWGTK